jgi:hypothetical protein
MPLQKNGVLSLFCRWGGFLFFRATWHLGSLTLRRCFRGEVIIQNEPSLRKTINGLVDNLTTSP